MDNIKNDLGALLSTDPPPLRDMPHDMDDHLDSIIQIMIDATAKTNDVDIPFAALHHLHAAYKRVTELDLFDERNVYDHSGGGCGPNLEPRDPRHALVTTMCKSIAEEMAKYDEKESTAANETLYDDYPSCTMETQIVSNIGCDVTDWVYADIPPMNWKLWCEDQEVNTWSDIICTKGCWGDNCTCDKGVIM